MGHGKGRKEGNEHTSSPTLYSQYPHDPKSSGFDRYPTPCSVSQEPAYSPQVMFDGLSKIVSSLLSHITGMPRRTEVKTPPIQYVNGVM